ncbi:MAG: SDR family NAD(P)-dependent oxidoreductase [Ilumatobacteraceae bacterium]
MTDERVRDNLRGSVAVITGAGSGMGEAFARRLASDGVHVAVLDINTANAKRVANEIDGTYFTVDVADSESFDESIGSVVAQHDRLDILINNAGIAPPTDDAKLDISIANQMRRFEGDVAGLVPANYLTDLTDQEWDRMLKVHLYGTFYGCRGALRHMVPARRGVIVNVSSILGLRHAAAAPHYAAAKAAIISLTKSVAEESAGFGVRVNAICPGWIDTPLLDPLGDSMKGIITSRIGIGRMGSPDEIAELVRFLCGPESSYCTGEIFSASGGYN